MIGHESDARKRRVFNSVFGTPSLSQPTPIATPLSGFTVPGQAFGGPQIYHDVLTSSLSTIQFSLPSKTPPVEAGHVEDQVRWDRAWHVATRILILPNFPEQRGILVPLRPERESIGKDFYEALDVLLYPQTYVPLARHTEDIVAWHTSQVRRHLIQQVLPIIMDLQKHNGADAVLLRITKILETAQRQYFHGLSFIKEHIDNVGPPRSSVSVVSKFRRDIHAVISNSVTTPMHDVLKQVLGHYVFRILGLSSHETSPPTLHVAPEDLESEKARREMLGLVDSLKNVGLASEQFQVTFAEVMNDSVTEYVYRGCKGVWSLPESSKNQSDRGSILPRMAHHSSPSRCVTDLCEWIEERYTKLAVQVLNMLDTKSNVSRADKERYKEIGIGRLAELRINELYDVVVHWPNNKGALDDLRTAITTPQRRLHLTEAFAKNLSEKLLHPGASTLQILQTYISMIWSFHALDHSKVLLDRVAYPLQLYLCSREDTVRIIITGLLSDTEDAQGTPITTSADKLVELAQLLNNNSEQVGPRADDEELDWHDMEWMPDPVDAGPGYKRSKNADIIGTLVGVLGSQEVFIKEFQNIMGENLLKYEGLFEKEVSMNSVSKICAKGILQVKVLELLKIRFGEAPLQACEVMLRDIQDSGRVNGLIRKKQRLEFHSNEVDNRKVANAASPNDSQLKPSLHTKILSRLFWPQLHDESYRVPSEISELQEVYAEGFESIKSSRKLTWLHALGQATVELELEDRTIVEEVFTWQATVIWAFQTNDPDENNVQKTVDELVTELEMDEALIRNALKFWVSKLVLQEVRPDTFSVLETLNQEDRERSNAQAAAAASNTTSNKDESNEDTGLAASEGIEKERMSMYWQFIQGMLKNSSSQMPLQDIAMMLKMLIVDGFPYSNEELQAFLGTKVADGSLEVTGGKYRLKK
jgi:anaphase-promoting complex subunit 2